MVFGFTTRQPFNPIWRRSKEFRYPRLLTLDAAALSKIGGVFVLWHVGVVSRWLYVGVASDLGAAIAEMKTHPDVSEREGKGGVFVTWAPLNPEHRDGVAAYLRSVLRPSIKDPNLEKKYAPVPNTPLIESVVPG